MTNDFGPLDGLIAPPFTPFTHEGALALDVVEQQAEFLQVSGVRGVFVAGSTGEGLSLSDDERFALAERWAEAGKVAGHVVLIHVGGTSLAAAQARAEHAQTIGADAISMVPPFYFHPDSVDVLVDYCAAVAARAPKLPLYYYHIPSMTGVDLPPHQFLEKGARRIPTLRGIKFTHNDIAELQRCLAAADGKYDVLFGRDEALIASLSVGVRGAVGTTYNIAAPLYKRLIASFSAGDMAAARASQAKSVALVDVLIRHRGVLCAAKATMKMLGVDCGPPRLPLKPLTDSESSELRDDLDRIGFFRWANGNGATAD